MSNMTPAERARYTALMAEFRAKPPTLGVPNPLYPILEEAQAIEKEAAARTEREWQESNHRATTERRLTALEEQLQGQKKHGGARSGAGRPESGESRKKKDA